MVETSGTTDISDGVFKALSNHNPGVIMLHCISLHYGFHEPLQFLMNTLRMTDIIAQNVMLTANIF